MRRRTFLAGLASVPSMMAMPRAIASQEPNFDGVTLRVHTWGGSWRDKLQELAASKLNAKGAKVEFIAGPPPAGLAKLIASRGQSTPPFDVAEFSDNDRGMWSRSGFLGDLDYSNIPNSAGFDPRFKLSNTVSTSQTQDGIIWNTSKFKEHGIPEPTSYAALMNPKLKGYIAFPDITVVHCFKALVGICHELGGSEADVGPALEFVKKLDAQIYWKSAVDLLAKFKAGDIWAAPWQAGGAFKGRLADVPLATSFLKVGTQVGVVSAVWIGAVKNSPNKRAAEYFMNEYLSAETQYEFAKFNGVVPQSAEATERLLAVPLQKELMRLAPQERAQFYYPDFGTLDVPGWTERWNRQILR